MSDAIERLVAQWREQGIELHPGLSAEQLDRFERDYSIRLPADFRRLYGLCNGMPEYGTDDDFFSLWPIDRVREEGGVWWHLEFDGAFLTFADAMISATEYVLRIHRSGKTSVVWSELPELAKQEHVADPISDFAAMHLAEELPGPFYSD